MNTMWSDYSEWLNAVPGGLKRGMRALVWSLSLLLYALAPNVLLSEAPNDLEVNTVVVNIRTVRAYDPATEESSKTLKSRDYLIDKRIEDLRSKLEKLNYRGFKLLSSSRAEIKMKGRETIQLVDGQTLTIRPLYLENKRACLWVKWNGQAGEDILDTRMHFDSGESMLTGTNHGDETGIVLAIDVKRGK